MDLRGRVFGTTYLSAAFSATALSGLCPTIAPLGAPGVPCASTWPAGGDSNLTQSMAAAATLAARAAPPTGAHQRAASDREDDSREGGFTGSAITAGSIAIATL